MIPPDMTQHRKPALESRKTRKTTTPHKTGIQKRLTPATLPGLRTQVLFRASV